MKKSTKVKMACLLAASSITLTGCNYKVVDFKYYFNKALIDNGNGTYSIIELRDWADYEGEQLQLQSKDGLYILASSYNTKLFDDTYSDIKLEDYAKIVYGEDNIVEYNTDGLTRGLSK